MIRSCLALLLSATLAYEAGAADPVDYDAPSSWLCRPDHPNACAADLDATVVDADGTTRIERFEAAREPAFDCFYVYPTVSLDETANSDMDAGPEELRVVQAQFARFGAVCRTFAPLYRQITLTALRARMAGEPMAMDPDLGYGDVRAAWNHYLEHDNDGRGVVLVGHSQGASVLTELIANEIDGQPIQDRIISAMLIGTSSVTVPAGADVGGAFEHVSVCRSPVQTGCVVSFASFRESVQPPANARFGRPRDGGDGRVACTNPANLAGGSAPLDAYLSAGGEIVSSSSTGDAWTRTGATIDTPFVRVPGLLSAQCVRRNGFDFLEVTVHGRPDDPRADDIGGDVVIGGAVAADWGLHLVDMHIAMGDLVHLAETQAEAWLVAH
ncbi:MAG: DUF3089 domain-containing protein [Pseudomonadales bacterium]|jgi:hypothetical protein|nr:DUF3089 domain-containing protein [Pseudomonadales bacterium]